MAARGLRAPVRLLAFVQKPLGLSPGQRYRLEQWDPHLRKHHQIHLDFEVFESPRLTEVLYQPGRTLEKATLLIRDTWRRRQALARARTYDGVVIYREAAALGPAVYERLLARTRAPIILDFDDAIWMPGPGSVNGLFARLKFPGKTTTICRQATVVTVGNQYLAGWARARNPNVFVVPTTIELDLYPVQPELPDESPFVIGWTGSHATLMHLEGARGPIERLATRHQVRLRVICSRPPLRPFRGVETEFIPWQEAREAEEVGRCHVGIMPLPDDEFARGKCGLKALQFMATGRPVVLSPVGVNREIVKNGENGLVAGSEDDWLAALESLATDPPRRRSLGAAARRTVETCYASTIAADRFAEAVRLALAQKGPV
jgi:glycosyltransferase involved in cell wall biosynthesis